jgi:hypothetical protein
MSSNCCFILDLQNHIPYNSPLDKYDDLHSFVDEIYFKETGTINLVFLVNIFTKMPLQTSIIESLLLSKHVETIENSSNLKQERCITCPIACQK